MSGLTEQDQQILAIERRRCRPGAKGHAIAELLGIPETRYYQLLNDLIDRPEALAAEPGLVNRLRTQRASRQTARSPARQPDRPPPAAAAPRMRPARTGRRRIHRDRVTRAAEPPARPSRQQPCRRPRPETTSPAPLSPVPALRPPSGSQARRPRHRARRAARRRTPRRNPCPVRARQCRQAHPDPRLSLPPRGPRSSDGTPAHLLAAQTAGRRWPAARPDAAAVVAAPWQKIAGSTSQASARTQPSGALACCSQRPRWAPPGGA